MMVSTGRGLTIKQEAFCLAYIETAGNASEAYRRAYPVALKWKDKSVWEKASTMLADVKVRSRIDELREAATKTAVKKLAIDKDWVLQQLVENVAMAKQAVPVLDADGKPTGEYKQNLAAGNKALELIGKELGMFIDRREIRGGGLLSDLPRDTLKLVIEKLEGMRKAAQ